MAESYWKRKAQEAVKAGYLPKNPWERELLRHLKRCFPAMLAQLQRTRQVNAYLICQTASAMNLLETLLEQGASPQDARHQARERLLPVPPEEQDRTALWELQSGQGSLEGVARQALLATTR